MYFTRQIKKRFYLFFFILKQTPLYGGLGLRSIIPHQIKFFGHQKSTNYLTVRSAYLPEKYQTFQLSRPSTSQMK